MSACTDDMDFLKNRKAELVTLNLNFESPSYIEIYGDYEDKAASITASMVYTIHFGDFRTSGGNMADFNLIRNYAYSYNVIFNGVNDIK